MSINEEVKSSLERIQEFDSSQLSRREELGSTLSFDEAVVDADRVISLFNRLPLEILSELPEPLQQQIKKSADSAFNVFDEIIKFDPKQQNAAQIQNSLVNQVKNLYDQVFQQVFPYISYSVSRTVDFNRLDNDARAAIQSAKDQMKVAIAELEEITQSANQNLENIQKVAAEQGVSQQAHHFAKEVEVQDKEAWWWRFYTYIWAGVLIAYGVGSLFLHKAEYLKPSDTPEAIIFISSKILIFAILSYMVILSAKNFLSHKHNATVNKHRQNALMTFNSLVDASGSPESKDIILNHAASCIFAPQDTGYIKANNPQNPNNLSVVELLPKSSVRLDS